MSSLLLVNLMSSSVLLASPMTEAGLKKYPMTNFYCQAEAVRVAKVSSVADGQKCQKVEIEENRLFAKTFPKLVKN